MKYSCAIMKNRKDNDWHHGSFDFEEAKEMLMTGLSTYSTSSYIAVIHANFDESGNPFSPPLIVDEIGPSDL